MIGTTSALLDDGAEQCAVVGRMESLLTTC
jgi:hypothetical protein